MKLFERDLCERLVELGCISESYAYYLNFSLPEGCQVQIFTLYDFIAPTKEAKNNREIVLAKKFGAMITSKTVELFINDIVYAESEHEAEQMIRKAIK